MYMYSLWFHPRSPPALNFFTTRYDNSHGCDFSVSSSSHPAPSLPLIVLHLPFQPGQDHRGRCRRHRRIPHLVLRMLLLLPLLPSGQEATEWTSPQARPGIATATAASSTASSTTSTATPAATANGHATAARIPTPTLCCLRCPPAGGLPTAAGIPCHG